MIAYVRPDGACVRYHLLSVPVRAKTVVEKKMQAALDGSSNPKRTGALDHLCMVQMGGSERASCEIRTPATRSVVVESPFLFLLFVLKLARSTGYQ